MAVALTDFQKRALKIPDDIVLVLHAGGRGGGKSYLACVQAIAHCEKYGVHAKCLFIRRTASALAEIMATIEAILISIYGKAERFKGDAYQLNRSEGLFRFANGATIRCDQLDYLTGPARDRVVGNSVSFLVLDEAGQYPEPRVLDQLLSNLRAPEHVPVRCLMTANPGGPGSSWLKRRFIDQAEPWTPFIERETGLSAIYTVSTFRDNAKLSKSYEANLRASVASDPALADAWLDGSFQRVAGSFFGDVWRPDIHIVDSWPFIPPGWDVRLSLDWGSRAPAVACLIAVARDGAKSPDGKPYAAGSAVVLGETHTAVLPSLSEGDGSSPAEMALRIKDELLNPYELTPGRIRVAVADPQIHVKSAGRHSYSIGDEFRAHGLRFIGANRTNRPARLQQIRSLLHGATKEGSPGLWITRPCEGLLQTLPIIQASPFRFGDIDTSLNTPRHWLDSLSYGLSTSRGSGAVRQLNFDGSPRGGRFMQIAGHRPSRFYDARTDAEDAIKV